MNKDILYLGSQSKPRQKLLELAGIDYKVLGHKSDECSVDLKDDFKDYVLSIAKDKMDNIIFPLGKQDEKNFVLTADTLVKTEKTNQILGKPKDIQDAKRMLRLLQKESALVITGCCLEKKVFKNGEWITKDKNYWTTKTIVEFCVDEDKLDWYLQKMPQALNACCAGIIEEYGQGFLKSVNGSYTSVLGLSLYELRQALKKMGFRF